MGVAHKAECQPEPRAGNEGCQSMTTNRMGLEQTLSDERLEDLAKGQYFFAQGAYEEAQAMARELLDYRKASEEPIGEVCLGEYDDSGSHPDARVVCLHSQADWNNFTDGFKLFSAPPLQAVTVPDGWINCSERMPDVHEPIYIFHPDYGVDQGVWYDNQEDAFLWDSDDTRRRDLDTVTHWMSMPPLPAAPSC